MEHVRLMKPTTALRDEYMDYWSEWKASGEEMIPWVLRRDPNDFEALIEWLYEHERGEFLPEGWVPSSCFWLVNEKRRILGMSSLRYHLNDFLLYEGGHIGYGIRPSERNNGYAAEILRLTVEQAAQLGITNVLVVCDAVNTASEKTILRNGGVADTDYIEPNGNVVKRYWITAR